MDILFYVSRVLHIIQATYKASKIMEDVKRRNAARKCKFLILEIFTSREKFI